MIDTYTKILENRIDELQDIVTSHNPTLLTIIQQLITIKLQYIEDNKIRCNYESMPFGMLLRDIFTIKINAGRAMGHSSAIHTIYKSDPINNIMICPSKYTQKQFPGSLTFDDINRPGIIFTKKLVLVDNNIEVTDFTIKKLYDFIALNSIKVANCNLPIIVLT